MKAAWLIVSGPGSRKAEAVARVEVIADTYLSPNAPIQWALPAFLEHGREFQAQLLGRVNENLAELDRQLARQRLCSRLEVEGGWSVVIRVPATRSDEELVLELLTAKGVYVHPGHFYDFPSEGYLVVSLITPLLAFARGMGAVLSIFKSS
jgi:alanine-synthesizing transaminase